MKAKKTVFCITLLVLMILSVSTVFAVPVLTTVDDPTASQPSLYQASTNGADNSTAPYIGNTRTKKFHYRECKWAKLYLTKKPHEVVYFNTRQEAVDAGYVPCKRCKP